MSWSWTLAHTWHGFDPPLPTYNARLDDSIDGWLIGHALAVVAWALEPIHWRCAPCSTQWYTWSFLWSFVDEVMTWWCHEAHTLGMCHLMFLEPTACTLMLFNPWSCPSSLWSLYLLIFKLDGGCWWYMVLFVINLQAVKWLTWLWQQIDVESRGRWAEVHEQRLRYMSWSWW